MSNDKCGNWLAQMPTFLLGDMPEEEGDVLPVSKKFLVLDLPIVRQHQALSISASRLHDRNQSRKNSLIEFVKSAPEWDLPQSSLSLPPDNPWILTKETMEAIQHRYSDESLCAKVAETASRETLIKEGWIVHLPKPYLFKHVADDTNPHHHQKEENNMNVKQSIIDVRALASLVPVTPVNDDLSSFLSDNTLLGADLKAALETAERDEKVAAVKEAAQSIRNLFNATSANKANLVNEIRRVRQAEKDLLDKLKYIERAQAYAKETNNYLPLAYLVISGAVAGLTLENNNLVITVPADWVAPSDRPDPDQKPNLVDNTGGTVVINGDEKGPGSPAAQA